MAEPYSAALPQQTEERAHLDFPEGLHQTQRHAHIQLLKLGGDPTTPPAKWKIASGSAVSIILASRVGHQGASPIARYEVITLGLAPTQ